jgi:hypothetical protein
MRDEDPVSWADAVEVDHAIRNGINSTTPGNQMFLHRSRVPLDQVDLSDPAEDQLGFSFMDECDGYCGI